MVTIDGTEISGVTIDGEDVSEITVDGDTVWTAIPDSAIHRWTLHEEGDTLADSIGSADGTNNGTTRVTGDYVKGAARDGDSSSNYILTSTWGGFGSNLGTGNAIAFTIEGDSNGRVMGVSNTASGKQILRVMIGSKFDLWPNGRVGMELRDENKNAERAYSNSAVTDGSKHRVVVNNPDATAGNMEFWIDGTDDGVNVESSQGAGEWGDFTHDVALFAGNNSGSIETHLNAILDDVIVFDSTQTQQQIQDDYNRQPWS